MDLLDELFNTSTEDVIVEDTVSEEEPYVPVIIGDGDPNVDYGDEFHPIRRYLMMLEHVLPKDEEKAKKLVTDFQSLVDLSEDISYKDENWNPAVFLSNNGFYDLFNTAFEHLLSKTTKAPDGLFLNGKQMGIYRGGFGIYKYLDADGNGQISKYDFKKRRSRNIGELRKYNEVYNLFRVNTHEVKSWLKTINNRNNAFYNMYCIFEKALLPIFDYLGPLDTEVSVEMDNDAIIDCNIPYIDPFNYTPNPSVITKIMVRNGYWISFSIQGGSPVTSFTMNTIQSFSNNYFSIVGYSTEILEAVKHVKLKEASVVTELKRLLDKFKEEMLFIDTIINI